MADHAARKRHQQFAAQRGGGRIAPQVAEFVRVLLQIVEFAPVGIGVHAEAMPRRLQGAHAGAAGKAEHGALALFFDQNGFTHAAGGAGHQRQQGGALHAVVGRQAGAGEHGGRDIGGGT
ncbi:hypothetical protein D9M68_770580 [compost metagenome]